MGISSEKPGESINVSGHVPRTIDERVSTALAERTQQAICELVDPSLIVGGPRPFTNFVAWMQIQEAEVFVCAKLGDVSVDPCDRFFILRKLDLIHAQHGQNRAGQTAGEQIRYLLRFLEDQELASVIEACLREYEKGTVTLPDRPSGLHGKILGSIDRTESDEEAMRQHAQYLLTLYEESDIAEAIQAGLESGCIDARRATFYLQALHLPPRSS